MVVWPRATRPPRFLTPGGQNRPYSVKKLPLRADCAIDSLHFRVRRFDYVILIGGVGAVAVAHTEMAGGQVQRVAGKDVSGPRSGAARQDDGIDSLAAIVSDLGADQRGVGGGAVRVVASGHVHFDVAEAAFREVSLQGGESFVSFHVRHQAQIQFGDGAVRKNRFAARAGVAADQAFDIHRGPRLQQFERLLITDVVHPVIDAELLLGNVLIETPCRLGNHFLFRVG